MTDDRDRQAAAAAPAADLLRRLEDFGLDDPDEPLAFEQRLADDQGWTLGYALAVAAEYRRFLVLTQVAGHAVSPSPDVDQAWHLHLTRTGHYERLCRALFGRFLHHEPARAGEAGKHRDMYAATLQAYRAAFGATAPPVIWPDTARALPAPAAAAPGWTIPLPLRQGRRLAGTALLLAVVGGLLLARTGWLDPLQHVGPVAFLAAALLALVLLVWSGLRSRLPAAAVTARDRLEPYEAAWLSGGAPRMALTAIAALTERGLLLPPGPAPERGPRPLIGVNRTVQARCVHPAEQACLAAATDAGLRFADACAALRPLAEQTGRRLVAAGVADDPAVLARPRARALLGLVALLAIEVERLTHALGGTHPVGFLAVLTLVGMVFVPGLARRPLAAGARAERALRPLRLSAGAHGVQGRAPRTGQALALGVALIGNTTLAGDLRFNGLDQQLDANLAGWTPTLSRRGGKHDPSGCSGGCGSSCGSSDAGGGGGSSCSSGCGGGCGGGGD